VFLDDLIEIVLSPTSYDELRSILDDFVGERFANPGGGPDDEDFFVAKRHSVEVFVREYCREKGMLVQYFPGPNTLIYSPQTSLAIEFNILIIRSLKLCGD
jgi:hypothetical protein